MVKKKNELVLTKEQQALFDTCVEEGQRLNDYLCVVKALRDKISELSQKKQELDDVVTKEREGLRILGRERFKDASSVSLVDVGTDGIRVVVSFYESGEATKTITKKYTKKALEAKAEIDRIWNERKEWERKLELFEDGRLGGVIIRRDRRCFRTRSFRGVNRLGDIGWKLV